MIDHTPPWRYGALWKDYDNSNVLQLCGLSVEQARGLCDETADNSSSSTADVRAGGLARFENGSRGRSSAVWWCCGEIAREMRRVLLSRVETTNSFLGT